MGMQRFFLIHEAIATTAMSHSPYCECDMCLAACGDKEAFYRVWLQTEHE